MNNFNNTLLSIILLPVALAVLGSLFQDVDSSELGEFFTLAFGLILLIAFSLLIGFGETLF